MTTAAGPPTRAGGEAVATPPTPAGQGTTPEAPSGGGARRGAHPLATEMLLTLLLALCLFIVISFALQTVRVDGPSMQPTLHGDDSSGHDILIADKLTYHLRAPERGDIVILAPPAQLDTDYIKRIVGVPGDTVEIVPLGYNGPELQGHAAARSEVLVKPGGGAGFQVLDEPYLPDQSKDPWTVMAACCRPQDGTASDSPSAYTIPHDEYMVLGDNRNQSQDSRSSAVGLIPRHNILARAWVRIWPLNRLGGLGPGPRLASLALLAGAPLLRRGRRRHAG